MRKILPITVLLLLSISVRSLIAQTTNNPLLDKISALDVLPSAYPDDWYVQVDSLLTRAQLSKNKNAEARILWLQGKRDLAENEIESSIELTRQALNICEREKNDTAIINCLLQLADACSKQENNENYDFRYLWRSMQLATHQKDTTRLIKTCFLLGNAYSTRMIYDTALMYGFEALRLCHLHPHEAYQAIICHGIGTRYFELGYRDTTPDNDAMKMAIFYFKQAMDLHEKRNDTRRYAHTLSNYAAALYLQNEKNPEIKPLYLKALQFQQKEKDNAHALETLYNLAIYEESIGQKDSSLVYWQAFRNLAQSTKHDDRFMLSFFKNFVTKDDSTLSSVINHMVVSFPIREIESKQKIARLEQQQIRHQIYSYSIFTGIILLGGIFLYRQRHKTQLDKAAREKQMAEIEAQLQEYQSQTIDHALFSEQEVRDKIGQDLHDGPAAYIAAGRWSMEAAIAQLEGEGHPLAAQLRNNLDMQNHAYVTLRSIIHRTEQDPAPWVNMVATFCSAIPEVKFTAYNAEQIPNGDFGRLCRRLVVELVHNARKHSQASLITVELVCIPDEKLLSITVNDNGRGFDKSLIPKPGRHNGSHGLANLVNITHELHGEIEFDTEANSTKGTIVSIDIPLPNQLDNLA